MIENRIASEILDNSKDSKLSILSYDIVNQLKHSFREVSEDIPVVLEELKLLSDVYSKSNALTATQLDYLTDIGIDGIADSRELVKKLNQLTKALEMFVDGVEKLTKAK